RRATVLRLSVLCLSWLFGPERTRRAARADEDGADCVYGVRSQSAHESNAVFFSEGSDGSAARRNLDLHQDAARFAGSQRRPARSTDQDRSWQVNSSFRKPTGAAGSTAGGISVSASPLRC